jgi:putative polyketide hydroxylase
MRHHETDVLVVGAGPAGLATAISAVTHGARVLVVERRAGTSTVPRATGLGTRAMEIVREWGLTDGVLAGALDVDPTIATAATLTAPVDRTASVGFPTRRESLRFSPAHPVACPQDHVEPLLAAELRRRGGRIRFGSELSTLDGHDAVLENGDRVHARFVVGADGPRSTVRRGLGLGWTELGGWGDWELLLFRGPTAPSRHALFSLPGGIMLPAGGGRWMYGRPLGDGARGVDHRDGDGARGVDHRHADGAGEWLAAARFRRDLLRRATGIADLEPEIVGSARFDIGAAVAAAMRVGDTFVIGDAAHRMTPAGGNGLNTALQDGHELGWRLGWAVRGWAGPGLLESFVEERQPVGEYRARRSLLPATVHAVDGLAGDLGWTYRSRTLAAAGPGVPAEWPSTGVGVEELPRTTRTARPGERLPHAWVRGRALLDLLGPGLTLFADDPRWRAAATGQAVPVATPRLSVSARRRLHLGAGSGVLARPDGVVVWRAEHPSRAALTAAVALATGRGTALRAA